MDLFFNLKPNEIAAIVFGIVGMVFGLASYKRAKRSEALSVESNERAGRAEARAIQNEERTRELAFAQRKADALNLITEGEAALRAARRKMMSLGDAALEAGASGVREPAENFVKSYEISLSGLDDLRKELESTTSAGRSHEELLTIVETRIAAIKRLTDPKLITEEMGTFVDQAERSIRVSSVHKEVVEQLKRSNVNPTGREDR